MNLKNTSPKLYRLSSYKERTSPTISSWDSDSFSNILFRCIFSGLVCNFPIREICLFFFFVFSFPFPHMLGISCSNYQGLWAELQKSHPGTFFVLSSPQTKYANILSALWVGQDRTQSFWRLPDKLECVIYILYKYFPREKLQAGYFLLVALSCASVEEGLTWVKWITFIYPLNCGCSWLWAYLGHCYVLKFSIILIIAFWIINY